MNFEIHDNLILADWTLAASPLCSASDAEITILEELVDRAKELAKKNVIEAVIWIQKVPMHDFYQDWSHELEADLFRDDLRWRLRRWYRLRQCIQYSDIPWFFITESSCQGTFFELMLACHRRYVFQLDTWFGFPEINIGCMPALGWVAAQLLKRQKLLESLESRPLMKASEAMQLGFIDAALSWKDWRLNLLPWAQRQIKIWQQEQSKKSLVHEVLALPEQLWPDKALREQGKSPIQVYLNAPRLRETPTTADYQLIDTAAHFYCQSAYGTWLRRNIQQLNAWGYQSRAELIFIDINEALPPLSIVARLLDNDHHLCFVATDAEVLRLGLEGLLTQLDLRYRRSAQQKFERNLAFYVGESPSHPEYPTIGFGAFRNFQFNFRDLRVRGWALSAQSMERQMAEIKHDDAPKAKILRIFFDGIYSLACAHQPRPALYYVKSLALQALVNYAKQSGETLPEILPQLRSLGWNLLGSERHWQRFLEYRAAIQSRVPVTEPDSIGSLDLEADLLKAVDWRAICEIALSHRRSPSVFHGPGCLQNFLVGFCRQLSQVLFEKSWVSSADQADLYVADALGFPDFWGTSASFDKRLGLARPFFQELDVQSAHHQRL